MFGFCKVSDIINVSLYIVKTTIEHKRKLFGVVIVVLLLLLLYNYYSFVHIYGFHTLTSFQQERVLCALQSFIIRWSSSFISRNTFKWELTVSIWQYLSQDFNSYSYFNSSSVQIYLKGTPFNPFASLWPFLPFSVFFFITLPVLMLNKLILSHFYCNFTISPPFTLKYL